MQHAAQPVHVLHRQWAVEPQFGADLGEHRRVRALLARQHERRVAGHQLLQAEHQHADQQQGRDELQQAAAQQPASWRQR